MHTLFQCKCSKTVEAVNPINSCNTDKLTNNLVMPITTFYLFFFSGCVRSTKLQAECKKKHTMKLNSDEVSDQSTTLYTRQRHHFTNTYIPCCSCIPCFLAIHQKTTKAIFPHRLSGTYQPTCHKMNPILRIQTSFVKI